MARVSDPHFDMVHTCRDWDSIHEWAVKNSAKTHFDIWTHVEDDLQYPEEPYDNVIQRFTHVDLHELHHYNFSFLDKDRPKPTTSANFHP